MFTHPKTTISSQQRRLISNWSIYTIGGLLPQALGIFLLPVFTRYLSPSDYGILSYTSMLCTFYTLLGSLSIQAYIVRFYYECKTPEETKQLFGTILLFILGANLLLLVIAYLALPIAFRVFHIQVPFSPYMQLALISTTIETIGLIPLNYYRAREQAAIYVGLSLLMTFMNGGLSVYLVVARNMGLLGRYYGQLAADLLLLILYVIIMTRIAGLCWRSIHIRRAMTFCLPLVLAQLLAAFTGMSDRLILERYAPLSQLGMYSVGFAVASSVVALTTGVYAAIQPYVCRLASEAKLDETVIWIKRRILVLAMGLICLMIGLSNDIARIVVASAFRESYKIASLLVVSIVMQAYLTLVPSLYLLAARKTQYESPVRFAGALIGFAALVVMVPRLGIYGAGIAAIVSALATLCSYWFVLRRQSTIAWGFGRDVAWMAGASLAGYGILQILVAPLALTVAIKLSLIAGLAALSYRQVTGRTAVFAPVAGVLGEHRQR